MTTETFANPGQVAILVTALVTLITTLATLRYNLIREDRRHRWEVEAAERHRETARIAEVERQELAKRVEEAKLALNAKIDENTEISKQAFTEANGVNVKLKAQGEAFDKMLNALFHADVEREARLAAAAVTAASKLADSTAASAASLAEKVITANETTTAIAADTSDTRKKVNEIRDKVVGNAD